MRLHCRNPKCRERLGPDDWFDVCPSCWVAGRFGSILALIVALVANLIINNWATLKGLIP